MAGTPDTISYLYNARSEFTNATDPVDAAYRYGYAFDDIGNRKTSAERGTNFVYTANSLNQYASITNISTFQHSNLPTPQLALANPWRFSSEYAEDDTATVYYNYRHYEPVAGRRMQRDPIEEEGGVNCYISCLNDTVMYFDVCGWYGSNLPGVLQWGYCENAYNYALEHLHTQQERAAWERYTNHGWRSADRNIHLSPEDVQHIAMSINAVSVYIKRKRESCKNGGKFEDSTSIGGNAPAPWVLAIGGVSININASCDDGCFSYCLSINDRYDFDIKGIPGFTSRSAKGEIVTWLVSISETCLQCDWATFYHVGSFCGRD